MKRILFALFVLLVLVSRVEAAETVHHIKGGETLSGIAQKYFHKASVYPELARFNGIVGPTYLIKAGKTLRIPDSVVRNNHKIVRTMAKPAVANNITTVRMRIRPTNLEQYRTLVASVGISVSFRISEATILAFTNANSVDSSLLISRPIFSFTSPLPSARIHQSSSSLFTALRSPPTSSCFSAIVDTIAGRVGIDPYLIRAVIHAESACNPNAVSAKGALGLMQLMPSILVSYRVSDPFDVETNIEAGTRHLKNLTRQYGDLQLVLAAYNAGSEAVNKYGGVPPFPETRRYIEVVKGWLHVP